MKLLLVHPNFEGVATIPSLGLGFIGTYVRDHSDCEVEIVEPTLQGLTETQVLDKAAKSDIVGLMCYTESRFQCFNFAAKVKQSNPDCKVVVGGPHVNALDEKILQHYPFVDAVGRMEGEETVLNIVQGRPFEQILGITWRNNGNIVRNPTRPMIKNIDALYYDYSLVSQQIEGWKDPEIPYELQKLNALPIIASRGCPFQCAFCAAHQQWGKTYRYCSPEELVRRMEYLVSQYNIGYFRFYDALFLGSEKRALKLCELLEKAGLDVHFRIDIRVGTSRNVLERLREVGCDVVGFGVESGSDKILKRMDKRITRQQVEETIRICKELDYWMIGFFMISFPDETIEDIEKTFELFKFFDRQNLQFFKIHPNTSIYDELKQRGEIDDEVWFDPDRGLNTTFGNEIFYCGEMFPSAGFCREEVDMFIRYSIYKDHIANPDIVIRNNGLARGALVLSRSAVMAILLKWEFGRKIYRKLRKTYVYRFLKLLYRHLTKMKAKAQ